MRSSRIRRHAAELDVTAFINLIVVLVPFLLSTAVFTRLSVIDLSLPAQNSGVEQLKVDELKLEIVIRPDALEVGDKIGGLISRIPNTPQGYDTSSLAQIIEQLKSRSPQQGNATVLALPDTSYEVLVQVMDAVRERPAKAQDKSQAVSAGPRHLDRRRAVGEENMNKPTGIQKRAERKDRNKMGLDMNLVSLIDIFTILIFFLLAQVGPIETLPSPKAVQLPMSTAEKDPNPAVVLVVSGTEILVEGRKVADLAAVAAQAGDLIAALKAELDQQAQRVAVRTENKKATNAIPIISDASYAASYTAERRLVETCRVLL